MPMVVMWDSMASSSDGDSAMGVLEKDQGYDRKRGRVCFFLKFGPTKGKRIENGKAKVNHANHQDVLYKVSNL